MYPGFMHAWKRAHQEHSEGRRAGCGPRGRRESRGYEASGHGGPFGVRRPLRFMAHKLNLSEDQIKVLAQILDNLKTERAQASVDDRRAVSKFAEAMEAEAFDASRVEDALGLRVAAAERMKTEVVQALRRTHEMLDEEQRAKLAYLLRSGTLTI